MEPDDELKALLALGIIASVVGAFQLGQIVNLSQIIGVPPAWLAEADLIVEGALLFFFAGYSACLAVSLAYEKQSGTDSAVASSFRWLSNVFFLGGSNALIIALPIFTLRLLVPWTGI